jgi:hypothetical protein
LPWLAYLNSPHNWDDRHTPPHPAISLRGGLLNIRAMASLEPLSSCSPSPKYLGFQA